MKIRTLPLRLKTFRTTKLALLVCHVPTESTHKFGRATSISCMQVLVAVEQVDVEELNDLVCAITDPEN